MGLQEREMRGWIGLIWLRIQTGGGCCECGNKPPDSIKCREFLNWLKTFYFLKKDSAPWRWLY
jgi:hypothetical protein